MEISVLVVNSNNAEGNDWRNELKGRGYTVLPECLNMSDMLYALTREKVHVVICESSLFNDETIPLFESSQTYFPRIKIVLVGIIDKDYLFSNLSNVAITKKFPAELEKYCDPPILFSDDKMMPEHQVLSVLLDDHFFTGEEAAAILAQLKKLSPGYVTICVRTDYTDDSVHKALNSCVEKYNFTHLLPYRQNEFIIIADKSPTQEFCLHVAADIRAGLLKETNTMFSIGISRLRYRAEELYACRKEAERACAATHMFGHNSIICIDYLGQNDIEYIYPSHKEKRLIEAAMDGDAACALQMLDEIFEVLKENDHIKQSLVNKMVLGILVGLNIAASSRIFVYEKMNINSLSLKKLMAVKTIDAAYAFLKQGICDFANEMDDITEVSRDALFHKLTASEYIPESAEELLQKFKTTLSYINTAIYENSKSDIFSLIREKKKLK